MIYEVKESEIKVGQFAVFDSPTFHGILVGPCVIDRLSQSMWWSGTKSRAIKGIKFVCDTEEEGKALIKARSDHLSELEASINEVNKTFCNIWNARKRELLGGVK